VLEVECADKSSKSPESTTIEYTTENSAETTTESSTDSPGESEPSTDSSETTTTDSASEASEASTDISTDVFTEALTEASTEVPTKVSTDVPEQASTAISTDSTTIICSNNEFWPAEDNCEAFYRCIGGQVFKFLCPAHKHYNANTKQCDEPGEAGCDVENLQQPVEILEDSSSETFVEVLTETAIEDCVNGEYQADDSNCEAFYRCFNGKFINLLCPPGKHYNSITRNCGEPEEAGCDVAMDQTLVSMESSVTDISVDADAPTENTKQTCSNNEYQADESNCEEFYCCINGQFLRLFCPTGKHFNFNNLQCDEPEVAGCDV